MAETKSCKEVLPTIVMVLNIIVGIVAIAQGVLNIMWYLDNGAVDSNNAGLQWIFWGVNLMYDLCGNH